MTFKLNKMDESKLAIISVLGASISIASVIQYMQVAALATAILSGLVGIVSGFLALRKHFKK